MLWVIAMILAIAPTAPHNDQIGSRLSHSHPQHQPFNVYVYVNEYEYKYACIYIYICIYIYMYVYIYINMYVYLPSCKHCHRFHTVDFKVHNV